VLLVGIKTGIKQDKEKRALLLLLMKFVQNNCWLVRVQLMRAGTTNTNQVWVTRLASCIYLLAV